MSLIVLLNPKQYGGVVDSSDVWRKRRKKLRQMEEAEEALAVEILLARRKELDNASESDKVNFNRIVSKAVLDRYSIEKERNQRLLLLLLLSDD